MKMSCYRYFSHSVYLVLCLSMYITAVVAYTAWSNHEHKHITIQTIDTRLLLAAKSIKYMLEPDFHDRAINKDSISFGEELRNRNAISGFAFETDFAWVYTIVKKDDKFYFSAPTVTQEEAEELESWYFYPYEDVPADFVQAYSSQKAAFTEYTDQWGHYRSIALPQKSPGGRVYLACADYDISYLNGLLRKNMIRSVLVAAFFFICSLPFIVLIWKIFSTYNSKLKSVNLELNEHRLHLEDLVVQRTRALQGANKQLQEELREREIIEEKLQVEKSKLEHALGEVKKLSGMLPICAACKKVRDDKGYWNQIEEYIQDHSDAQFSHSLCPECAKDIYPNYSFEDKKE